MKTLVALVLAAGLVTIGQILYDMQQENAEAMTAINKDMIRTCLRLQELGGTDYYSTQLSCKRLGVEIKVIGEEDVQ